MMRITTQDIVYYVSHKLGYPIKNIYQLLEPIIGTKAREWEWARRHNMAEDYWQNRNLPAKEYIVNTVFNLPFTPKSILEVGCASGPSLYLLAKSFPATEIVGVDINDRAVQMGNKWFKEENIANVRLLTRRAEELDEFPDKHFDVVFTFATLLLIGPDKIGKVISQIFRVASRMVILVEAYGKDAADPNGFGFRSDIYWKRDYASLIRHLNPERITNVKVDEVPPHLWAPGCGGGSVVYIDVACGRSGF